MKILFKDGNTKNIDNLSGADLSGAYLYGANLHGADLSEANLSVANLSVANLSVANLSKANLSLANLSGADLHGANLSKANLSLANLSEADLHGANLSEADLYKTNLHGADLSGTGLPSQSSLMNKLFERHEDGYIVYKIFELFRESPTKWVMKKGSIITETVNHCRTDDCGCGINVATLGWINKNNHGKKVWKCFIKDEWLIDTCVPYNTDGKIRCGRLKLLEIYKK